MIIRHRSLCLCLIYLPKYSFFAPLCLYVYLSVCLSVSIHPFRPSVLHISTSPPFLHSSFPLPLPPPQYFSTPFFFLSPLSLSLHSPLLLPLVPLRQCLPSLTSRLFPPVFPSLPPSPSLPPCQRSTCPLHYAHIQYRSLVRLAKHVSFRFTKYSYTSLD